MEKKVESAMEIAYMRAAMFKKMGGDATKVIVEQDWEKAKAKIEH